MAIRTLSTTLRRLTKRKEAPFNICLADPSCLNKVRSVTTLSTIYSTRNIPLLISGTRKTCLHFLPNKDHRPVSLNTTTYYSSNRGALPILAKKTCLRLNPGTPIRRRDAIHDTLTLFNSADPSCLVLRSLSTYGQLLSASCPTHLRRYYSQLTALHTHLGTLTTTRNTTLPLTLSDPTQRPVGLALSTTTLNLAKRTLTSCLQRGKVRYRCTSPHCLILVFAPRGPTRSVTQLRTTLTRLYTKNVPPTRPPTRRQRTFYTLTQRTRPHLAIQRTIFTPRRAVPTKSTLNEIYTLPAISYPPTVPVIIDNRIVNPTTLRLFMTCNIRAISIIGPRGV